MRDNWHRFEWAERDCQPATAAARPVAKARWPRRPAVPVQSVVSGAPLKPLAGTTPGARDLTP